MSNELGKSASTETKQNEFEYFLTVYLSITKAILNKSGWAYPRFQYVDMYAGSGRYLVNGNMTRGSPLIFLETATRLRMEYDAYFFESDKESIEKLAGFTKNFPNINIIPGDNAETISELALPSHAFGLVYADNNSACPQVPILKKMFALPEFQFVDFLINLGTTGIKRAEWVKCSKCDLYEEKGNLSRCFNGFKKYTANTLTGRGIWSFLWVFYSNYAKIMQKFTKIGMIHGDEARSALDKAMMTREYIKDREEFYEHRYDET